MKVQKAHVFNAGDRSIDSREEIIPHIEMKVHKFTKRVKPLDRRNITIIPLFAEFGCETLAVIYCLPKLLANSSKYVIVMGWQGREYLYRHLVDEFWELPEDCMWLREYTRAFHHVSKNLKRLEKNANNYGQLLDVYNVGNMAVFPKLDKCAIDKCDGLIYVEDEKQKCSLCKAVFPQPGVFTRIEEAKKEAKWVPDPSKEKMELVKKYLPNNAVGVTARKRKTWGRNLDPIFYERLIYLLEDMGYNPVWIGEKITSLPCPFKRIVDFSITNEANDLECTLALVKQMKFTIQFWTASSRLAAIMGVPYIIFESPDQIFGIGQEGMRLNLLSRERYKLVISHYKNVHENNTEALNLVYEAVRDIEDGNYDDIVGLVGNKEYVKYMKSINEDRIGDV